MGARFEVCDEPSAFELTYLSTFFFFFNGDFSCI